MICTLEFSILLFASLKDAAGAGQITVQVQNSGAQAITVDELLRECATQYPAIAKWLPYVRVAVNCTYAAGAQTVCTDDEIALLPPVSGGATQAPERS